MGFLTITGVEVTADLRFAKVYVSVFGQDRDKKRSLAALESAKGFIRRRVGEEGNLRFVPELAFAIDETAEETQKVTGILQRLRQEQEKEGTSLSVPGTEPMVPGTDKIPFRKGGTGPVR